MKDFSDLLKTTIAKRRITMIRAKLMSNLAILKSPEPMKPYLKHSKIGVKGFKSAKYP
jgi:hypothetical protein